MTTVNRQTMRAPDYACVRGRGIFTTLALHVICGGGGRVEARMWYGLDGAGSRTQGPAARPVRADSELVLECEPPRGRLFRGRALIEAAIGVDELVVDHGTLPSKVVPGQTPLRCGGDGPHSVDIEISRWMRVVHLAGSNRGATAAV